MKKFAVLFCFLLAFGVWGKVGKLVFSEQAVFKIEERIFLLSDIVKLGNNLVLFRCLHPDALILQSLDLDKKNQSDVPAFTTLGEADLLEDNLYLQKMIKLIKLNIFVGKQNVELDKSSLNAYKGEKCGVSLGGVESWPKELKELFVLEGFWIDRFSVNSYKLNEREVDEIKNKTPKGTKAATLKKLLDEQRDRLGRTSAQALIKTVDKQIPHELFY